MHYINKDRWKELSRQNLEKTFSLLNKAEEHICSSPESMKEFLRYTENLPQFSLRNTALLFEQRPQGRFFLEAGEFENAGYTVNPGETGNKIFLSFEENGKLIYRLGTVFDLTQTDIPQSDYENFLAPEANYSPEEIASGLSDYAKSLHISVESADLPDGNPGFFQQDHEKDFHQGKIILSTTLDPTTKASEMARSFAHALLTMDQTKSDIAEVYEFQADTLSLLMCSTFGLDSPSLSYSQMHQHWQAASQKSGSRFFELAAPAFITFRAHRSDLENEIDQQKELQAARENARINESAAQRNYRMDQIQQMHAGPEVEHKKGRAIERDMEH